MSRETLNEGENPGDMGGFQLFRMGEPIELDPPMVIKWFRLSSEHGIEFHGYEASEVVAILGALPVTPSDAVRYTP